MLFLPLAADARVDLRQKLYGIAAGADGNIPAGFFNLFGEEVEAVFDAIVVGKQYYGDLFIPIVKARNVRGLEWLSAYLGKPQHTHYSDPPPPVIEFEIQLREAAEQDPADGASPTIKAVLDDHFGPAALFVYDKDTILQAYTVNRDKEQVDLTVKAADGKYKRFQGVRLDQETKQPGTYHLKVPRSAP